MTASIGTRLACAAPAIATGAALFMTAGAIARTRELGDQESAVYAAVNELPDAAHPPAWFVMQSGSLGGVGVVSGAAWLLGRRRTAVAAGVAGSAVWAGAKLVKRAFGRGRPSRYLETSRTRGRPASGLGFPSGHAAVSMTLAFVVAPELPAGWRTLPYAAAAVTGLARMYVGAHLPADIVGGAGIGLAAGALADAVSATRYR